MHLFSKLPKGISITLDDKPLELKGVNTVIFSSISSYAGGSRLLSKIEFTKSAMLNVFVAHTYIEYIKLILSRFNFVTFKLHLATCKFVKINITSAYAQLDGESVKLTSCKIRASTSVRVHHLLESFSNKQPRV